MIAFLTLALGTSWAADLNGVDPLCYDAASKLQSEIASGKSDYNEQAQQDFLLNYFAMATTMSPLHAPVPHESGKGSLNVEFLAIPLCMCTS